MCENRNGCRNRCGNGWANWGSGGWNDERSGNRRNNCSSCPMRNRCPGFQNGFNAGFEAGFEAGRNSGFNGCETGCRRVNNC